MLEGTQLTLEDVSEEYKAFLDKFKPKKTTDDCYTPPNVYNAVLGWVIEEYGIDPDNIIRPFWPGGDYLKFDYPDGGVVVDNPPFSIISQISADYVRAGIRFFLFAPYLTNFSSQAKGITHIITDADIEYENGAKINTAFLTNLDDCEIRTAPSLSRAIKAADDENRKEKKKTLPKYEYPTEVLTATMMGYIGKHGIDLKIYKEDCFFIRCLDSQKAVGKCIFGSGYLLSEKAAAEKAAAHRWPLSDREKAIINKLGTHDFGFNPYQE